MSEKRKYVVNENYKSIAIRFNITDKDEKKLFVFLNSMSSEDRTTFILEMYEQKGNVLKQQEKPNEMSVYEKRLFDIVEKAIGSQSIISPVKIETEKPKENKIKSNNVNYDTIELNTKKEESVDLESLIDGFTENGMRD